jgi:ceramide glucosyltransferase
VIQYLLGGLFAASAAYQFIAILASIRHLLSREPEARFAGPVSVLKPISGLDPKFYAAIQSQVNQDHSEFEVLFGVADRADPALEDLKRLQAEFPAANMRLVWNSTSAANAKVGTLIDLEKQAQYPIQVVNDSDVRVDPDYLTSVTGPLADPAIGMVTCLYRAEATSFPGRFEALGIATDFAPSVLVAPLFGVNEFGLGSTLAFRKADLQRAGGFESIADFIADDYQLGKRISGLGLKVLLSRTVVSTSLGGQTWGDVWRHQLRWGRTIRVSRGGDFLALPITNAGFWMLVAAASGWWRVALALLLLRWTMALVAGVGVLRCGITARLWWLSPVRDLWGLAVWAAALRGREVIWRHRRLRLRKDGRIQDEAPRKEAAP